MLDKLTAVVVAGGIEGGEWIPVRDLKTLFRGAGIDARYEPPSKRSVWVDQVVNSLDLAQLERLILRLASPVVHDMDTDRTARVARSLNAILRAERLAVAYDNDTPLIRAKRDE